MIEEIILDLLNRIPVWELTQRYKEEKKSYILQDGRVVKVIQEP